MCVCLRHVNAVCAVPAEGPAVPGARSSSRDPGPAKAAAACAAPGPPAPFRPVVGRGLCVLCVAECRGRGASPAARYFQSCARRKAPYQDKSPRRHPPAPARPRGRWEALAPPMAAFIALVASASDLTLRAPSPRRRRQSGAVPGSADCPVGSALLALPVGRGRSPLRSSGASKPQPFLRFAAWRGLLWTAAVSQDQGRPSRAIQIHLEQVAKAI